MFKYISFLIYIIPISAVLYVLHNIYKMENTELARLGVLASLVSSLGIFVTLFVYYWQKLDSKKKTRHTIKIINKNYKQEINSLVVLLCNIRTTFESPIKNNNTKNKISISAHGIPPHIFIKVNTQHINTIIPSDSILKILYSEAIKIDLFLSEKILKDIIIVKKIIIFLDYIRNQVSNDGEEAKELDSFLIENTINRCNELLKELNYES